MPEPLVLPDLLHRAVDGPVAWGPFRDGVEISIIYQVRGGSSAALLRYAPGAVVPDHEHGGYEHILVLSGSQIDERGEHRPGTLVVNPTGSHHSVRSPEGCVVLAVWEKSPIFAS